MRDPNESSQVDSMSIRDLSDRQGAIKCQLECDSVFRGAVVIREQFRSDCRYGRARC